VVIFIINIKLKVFITQERAVLQATARDLEQVKSVGIALNCQTLEYGGEQHYAISANYITDDWRITRRTLRFDGCRGLMII
jgi:hypothetical protein